MKEIYQQNKHDVTKFISESIDQLVERSVSRTLQEVRMRVNDRWNAMHKVLQNETAKSIWNQASAKRFSKIYEARQKCWIKMGAYSDVAGMLYKIQYEEYM